MLHQVYNLYVTQQDDNKVILVTNTLVSKLNCSYN